MLIDFSIYVRAQRIRFEVMASILEHSGLMTIRSRNRILDIFSPSSYIKIVLALRGLVFYNFIIPVHIRIVDRVAAVSKFLYLFSRVSWGLILSREILVEV